MVVPVLISFVCYKKTLRGDEHNLVVAFDKLVLDNITQPNKQKKRGLGWIVDDKPEYMTLMPPEIRKGTPERTVITFHERID